MPEATDTTTNPALPPEVLAAAREKDRLNAERWRRYLRPNGTLKNLPGLDDPARLARFERGRSALAEACIRAGDHGPFEHSPAGYRRIHKLLFGDVYPWAGRTRTVDLERVDTLVDGSREHARFLAAGHVNRGLRTAFEQLAPALPRLAEQAERPRVRRDVELVAAVSAAHAGALNYVHPFRTGNGRTLRQQLDNLARTAGLHFDQAKLLPGAWDEASRRLNRDPTDLRPMREAVAEALEPRERIEERVQEARQRIARERERGQREQGGAGARVHPHRPTRGQQREPPAARPLARRDTREHDYGL